MSLKALREEEGIPRVFKTSKGGAKEMQKGGESYFLKPHLSLFTYSGHTLESTRRRGNPYSYKARYHK